MKFQPSALALAAVIAAAPLAAGANPFLYSIPAASGTAPVQINAVLASRGDRDYERFVYPHTVAVTFTNLNPAAAKHVVFGLRDNLGRLVDTFGDTGTFTQGVAIQHKFQSTQLARDAQVDVEEATFSNGTVWHNGEASPLIRRQALSGSFDLPSFPEVN